METARPERDGNVARRVVCNVLWDGGMVNLPRMFGFIALFGALIGGVTGAISAIPTTWLLFPGLPVFIGVIGVIVATYRSCLKRHIARIHRVLAEQSELPLEQRISSLRKTVRNSFETKRMLVPMLRVLLEQGHAGTTFRLGELEDFKPITPAKTEFEPREFIDLAEVLEEGERAENTTARHFKRNVQLQGGWWYVSLLTIMWTGAASMDLLAKRISWPFIAWTVTVVLILFPPRQSGFAVWKQWLAVPAGLVRRQSTWRRARWKLHLFKRRESVLLLGRIRANTWLLVVVDAQAEGVAYGTKTELEHALRAWLSPLEPPAVEVLSDLE